MRTAKDIKGDSMLPAASIEALIEALNDPVAIVDSGWLIVSANARLLDLIGYSIEELKAKHLSAVCSMSKLDINRLTGAEGPAFGVKAGLITKKGGLVPVTIYASHVPEGMGPENMGSENLRMIAVSAIPAVDQTSLAEMQAENERLSVKVARLEEFREGVLQILQELDTQEAELDGAYARLAAAQAHLIQTSKLGTLGELAAGLAHELNQPVTVIKGLAQSLLKSLGADPASIEKAQLIAEAASRMELIIRHMNIFARAKEQELVRCDINAIVRDAFRLSGGTLRQKAIDVSFDFGEPPAVKGSPVRLEQVIMNLIANARDAMPDGGRLSVRTSTIADEKGHGCALVSVSDTGIGISEDVMAHIFDPFFTTKEPGKGTGLGLSISRGIVRDHGGDIRVESTPGRGATFHMTIPAMGSDER